LMGDTFYGAYNMVNDGEGGIIFVKDRYIKDEEMRVYLQRMSPEGEFMWDSVGVKMLCYHDPDSFYWGTTALVSDGQGGAIFCYENGYFQRVDRDSHKLWGDNLIHPWPEAPDSTPVGDILTMRDGGAILVGLRYEGVGDPYNYYSAKAQRLDGDGNPLWGEGGIQVSPVGIDLGGGSFPDERGGAIIIWSIADTLWGVNRSVYAQRIDDSGNLLWDEDGVLICDGAVGSPDWWRMCTDGTGGMIIAWEDGRNETNSDCDIYAQRVDSVGVVRWEENGLPISKKPLRQTGPGIISDDSGGAIIVWTELNYETERDVYGQQVNAAGSLGVVYWVEPEHKEILPSYFALLQNYPNPFNASTTLNYTLPQVIGERYKVKGGPNTSHLIPITLKVYNILGQVVRTLVDGKQRPGYYSIVWDGKDDNGMDVSSGIYFCRLEVEGLKAERTRKMVLLR